MNITRFFKSFALGLLLSLGATQATFVTAQEKCCSHTHHAAPTLPPVQGPSLSARASSFTGSTLRTVGQGIALCGLAYSGYQIGKAAVCWFKACQACDEDDAATLRAERNNSALNSFAGLAVAGVTHGLMTADISAVVYHIDIGQLFVGIANILSRRK